MPRKLTYIVEVIVDEDPHEGRREALSHVVLQEFEDFLTGRQFNVQGSTSSDPGQLSFVVQSVYVRVAQDRKKHRYS